jgi:hypothetical protein
METYWKDKFDERQQKEINLAILYARDFSHGTTGHNALLIIAKMAQMLDDTQEMTDDPTPIRRKQ